MSVYECIMHVAYYSHSSYMLNAQIIVVNIVDINLLFKAWKNAYLATAMTAASGCHCRNLIGVCNNVVTAITCVASQRSTCPPTQPMIILEELILHYIRFLSNTNAIRIYSFTLTFHSITITTNINTSIAININHNIRVPLLALKLFV